MKAALQLRLQHDELVEDDVHAAFIECAGQQAHLAAGEGRIVDLRDREAVDVKRERVPNAIGAQVVDGHARLDVGGQRHLLLPQQDGFQSVRPPDRVIPVTADDEEIKMRGAFHVLKAAEDAGAVGVGTGQFGGIHLDAHIGVLPYSSRRGPVVEMRSIDEEAVHAAVIIHDAAGG